jgi:hypothetical protein
MDEMAGYHTGVIDLMINPNRELATGNSISRWRLEQES